MQQKNPPNGTNSSNRGRVGLGLLVPHLCLMQLVLAVRGSARHDPSEVCRRARGAVGRRGHIAVNVSAFQ